MNEKEFRAVQYTGNAFCERLLENAVLLNCTQYVDISSGFDLSSAENKYDDLQIFKPDALTLIPSLTQNGFEKGSITFGNLLGVSPCLKKEEFAELISNISMLWSIGSCIVFDFYTSESFCENGCAYSYEETEKLLSRYGFLIYEHIDHNDIDDQYLYRYNIKHIRKPLKAPLGFNLCLAVKRR